MIHVQNYLDVRSYLHYLAEVRQLSPRDRRPARAPTCVTCSNGPARLLCQNPASSLPPCPPTSSPPGPMATPAVLSPSSIKKGLECARQFFRWGP